MVFAQLRISFREWKNIETDHFNSTRRPEQMVAFHLVDFAVRADYRMKWKQNDKTIGGSCQRAENAVEHEGHGYTNFNWCVWNRPQKDWKNWKSEDEKRLGELMIGGKINIIRTIALLKSARYSEKSYWPEKIYNHLDSSERPPARME